MAVHDISLTLRSMQPPWPQDFPFIHEISQSMDKGDECNVSRITLSTHFATHLDAPYHFHNTGLTVEQVPLDALIGPALVHEVNTEKYIEPKHLPELNGIERILFKTPNSMRLAENLIYPDYVALNLDAAKILIEAGIRLVGIDYYSIEEFVSPGNPVHHLLCGNSVMILEGLNLRRIKPGRYELIALPLKIEGADGSPCRAILRDL